MRSTSSRCPRAIRRGEGRHQQCLAENPTSNDQKAVARITDHLDVLAFYHFPTEHSIHLRASNPIESTFATVRLQQRITQGPGSRAA